jgi:hypothetical protein
MIGTNFSARTTGFRPHVGHSNLARDSSRRLAAAEGDQRVDGWEVLTVTELAASSQITDVRNCSQQNRFTPLGALAAVKSIGPVAMTRSTITSGWLIG